MTRPIVGIIGNSYLIDGEYPAHAAGKMNCQAVSGVTGAIPMIVPTDPALVTIDELLETCDGFLLTGGRANVHPEEYGERETPAHGTFDRDRDAITLPLTRACVDRGQPLLAVCRGFQELNVALGGTLHPEIRELPGRMNHRMTPNGSLDEKFVLRHDVTLTEGSVFHRIFGSTVVKTNTLHGQGIKAPGPRIVVDGEAGDGTAEAISVRDAPGFVLGVQWHPEYKADADSVSRPLFEAFGDACRAWQQGQRPGDLAIA
ncbi:MAG: gamma-glutamyl-gamma-aminobutyrate hydrolase family protein [Pseudomonadota bacterium]